MGLPNWTPVVPDTIVSGDNKTSKTGQVTDIFNTWILGILPNKINEIKGITPKNTPPIPDIFFSLWIEGPKELELIRLILWKSPDFWILNEDFPKEINEFYTWNK